MEKKENYYTSGAHIKNYFQNCRQSWCEWINSQRILPLQREHGNVESKRKGKCGRNKVTTNKVDRKILRASLKNPKLSAVDINRELKSFDIEVSTVCQRLLLAGLKACQRVKKQFLTKAMRKKRLLWARTHTKWTTEDWKWVTFCDENHFFVQEQ